MPFARPTLKELRDQIKGDLESQLDGADARLPRKFLAVLAAVLAGVFHGLYGFLVWISKQMHPLAKCEEVGLLVWAEMFKKPRKPPTFATGTVTFIGTDETPIDTGTIIARKDGVEFLTDTAAVIDGTYVEVEVTAANPGENGNTDLNTVLFLVEPIAGITSVGCYTSAGDYEGIKGGTDQESLIAWGRRILARIANPPSGGNGADYLSWATDVAGVTRAWVYEEEMGPGTVTVRFVRDDDPDGIIPDGDDVDAVKAAIEAKRPVTDTVYVVAPTTDDFNVTISGLVTDTPAVRAAITAQLTDFVKRNAEPGGTLLLSQVREAISIATGETDHVLVSPTANKTHSTGQMPEMGTVNFV